MESECCGASEWMDETGICSECKEHADFYDEEQEETDERFVLLEEGYPHTVLLNKIQAEELRIKYSNMYPNLDFSVFYDEYYEFTEITKTN